jgi:Putative auto-transporter adhesin, head GIN domain
MYNNSYFLKGITMKLVHAIIAMCLCSGVIKPMDMNEYIAALVKKGATVYTTKGGQGTTITTNKGTYQRPITTGSGQEKINDYNISGIEIITFKDGDYAAMVGNGVKFKFTQHTDDQTDKLTIKAEDNIIPLIVMKYAGNHLELGLNSPNKDINATKDIVFTIALRKKIEKLNLNARSHCSVGMLNNALQLKTDILSINKKGSAKIDLTIDTNILNVENDGGGELKLAGNATNQDLKMLHGSFLAENLKSETIKLAVVDGTGTIKLNAAKSITGTVANNSNYEITYDGTAEVDLRAV